MKTNSIYPSRYLKADDLEGKSVVLTISDLTIEKFQDEEKPVLTFVETKKEFIVNKTNLRTIEKILGSDDTDDWKGKQIILLPAKVDFKGDSVETIRIQPTPARIATKITDDDIPF